jgi:hypothetical protein
METTKKVMPNDWQRVLDKMAGNLWCFAKAGLRRINVELTTKDN